MNSGKIKTIVKIVYIIFLLSVLLVTGLAKFRTTYSSSSTAVVAKPIINLVTSNSLTISELHNEEYEYTFKVNNFEGTLSTPTEVNQVTVSYKIGVDLGDFENLEYTLYRVNGANRTEVTMTNGEMQTAVDIAHTTAEEHEYCLVINTTDDIVGAGLTDEISLNVLAIQKNSSGV